MKTYPQNKIQESFDQSLIDDNLKNITTDFTEVAIDKLLDNNLIKDIPIISTFFNIISLGVNIHDKLFLKKILSFLYGIKDINLDDRKRIIKEIDESKKYRIKVGEKLLYIIDNCNDFESSEKIAEVFKYFIEQKITYNEFLKVANILEGLSSADFNWFIKERKNYYFDLSDVGDLISSGLFELYYDQIDVQVSDQDDHKILRDNPNANKYKTKIDGGGISVHLSRAGEIILEVFCSSYTKPKTVKL